MAAIRWTHPSVVRVLERQALDDPVPWVEAKARDVALEAIERGWEGPPYDPFELAELLGAEIVARQDLDDARLVNHDGHPRIEFNPQRSRARVRFSIAHELGHFFFEDYAERTRYRDLEERRGDDWQLEVLCNVAAAELLMPIGTFPVAEANDLSLIRLLDERMRFGVSTEALLRRVVRLTTRPTSLFAAARVSDTPDFRIDYVVPSRHWRAPIAAGDIVGSRVLARCTAVGYADHDLELWGRYEMHVQAVGVPPYPGETFPRLVGLVQPSHEDPTPEIGIRYVRGDAADPRCEGPAIVAHVVNDKAQRWGGFGFARQLVDRFPAAASAYTQWPRSERRLGRVHVAEARPRLWIASLVAQAGYGPAEVGRPRLRIRALREALELLAQHATSLAAEVHMPLIGTGQAGMKWPMVRDLLLQELCDRRVGVTVYLLPDAAMPDEAGDPEQLALL